ncbi:MAG: aminoacyl-tRNA hydrolase [Oscillospiraceae bacterium]
MFNKIKNIVSDKKSANATGSVEFLIVGLGNVGKEYENTRHNAGFLAVDCFCEKNLVKADRLKYKALCCEVIVGGKKALVMKPTTFMNNSGEAVIAAMNFYKIPIENVIVIQDDISLDIGKMRIRRKGSDGGQKGIRSIITLSGKDTFPRIKIGVGQKPHPDYDLASWVLSKFPKEDMKTLGTVFENCTNAIELIVKGETDAAMNKYNS